MARVVHILMRYANKDKFRPNDIQPLLDTMHYITEERLYEDQ